MPARSNFSDRISRIEKNANASPRERSKLHTPTPGTAEERVNDLRPRRREPSAIGGFLSMLSGMAIGMAILGAVAVVFSDELDKHAPEGFSISALVEQSPMLTQLKETAGAVIYPDTQLADNQ